MGKDPSCGRFSTRCSREYILPFSKGNERNGRFVIFGVFRESKDLKIESKNFLERVEEEKGGGKVWKLGEDGIR